MPAGHEDARAFYQCEKCNRVWMTFLADDRPAEHARASARSSSSTTRTNCSGLMDAWLQEEGYVIVTATSGMQALDAAETYEPDVVLLDVVIPPPDGFASARRCSIARIRRRSSS